MTARVVPSWSMVCDSCEVMIRGVDTKKSAQFFMREHNKAVHDGQYLEDLDAVSESAGELWGADAIGPWLDHHNAFLRGTPRELIQQGETSRVLAMLEALKEGVVF